MSFESHERAHFHAKRFQLLAAAEFRQVDHEAGGDDFRAQLAQQLDGTFGGAPVAIRSSQRITLSPGFTASTCISISSVPYSRL